MLNVSLLRGMRTVVLGGELKPETEALVGPDALANLRPLQL